MSVILNVNICIICDREASIKCVGCGKVLYCSEEHKDENFTSHKNVCKPYRMEKDNIYGRYLVTSRDVKQGEVLLREHAFMVGPKEDSLPACLECFSLLYPHISRCSVCGVIPLCSQCSHNFLECQFYSSLSEPHKALCMQANTQHILPLKVILHLKAKEVDINFKYFLEMESHLEKRRESDVWISHQKNVVELLQTIGVIEKKKKDAEMVQHICGVLDVNSFEVRGAMGLPSLGMCLRGVYLEAALMAHNCITNVHISVDNDFRMCIRASIDIPEGQPIFYNYTDPLQATSERQNHLREGKYFSCNCKRCNDPSELGTYMAGIRCPRCMEGYILSPSTMENGVCENCTHKYSRTLIGVTNFVAHDRLDSLDRNNTLQLENVLTELSMSFSPTHSILMDIKQSIVAAHRETERTKKNVERKIELCRELLAILTLIEPGISRRQGMTLYELHIGLVVLARDYGEIFRYKEAEEVLREAVRLLFYEPKASPEGALAHQAMSELKALKQTICKQKLKDQKKKI